MLRVLLLAAALPLCGASRRFVATGAEIQQVRAAGVAEAAAARPEDLLADPTLLFTEQWPGPAPRAAAPALSAALDVDAYRLAVLDGRSLFEISPAGLLAERYFTGAKSVSTPHPPPGEPPAPLVSVVSVSSPGPAQTMYHGVVVLDATGRVFQRLPAGPQAWADISPDEAAVPGGLVAGGACSSDGAALFVSAEGQVVRRDFARERWEPVGRPDGQRVAAVADAGSLLPGLLFCISDEGALLWLHNGEWRSMGRPPNGAALGLQPGVAIRDLNAVGSLFLTAGGTLWELWWNPEPRDWQWVPHGHPEGRLVLSAPGALVDPWSLFVVVEGGQLYERQWDGSQWVWISHRAPSASPLAPVRPAAVDTPIILVQLANGKLAARQFRKAKGKWAWKVFTSSA